MKLLLCFLALSACSTRAQEVDIEEELKKIFTTPPSTVVPKNPEPLPGTATCTCVPYYLCNNNTIITDGIGLIDIRIEKKGGPCTESIMICCNNPDIVETVITPPPDLDKQKGCGVRNPDGVGFRIKGDQDNEAQFGEFPWMVAVLREESVEASGQKLLIYQCGASMIHPSVVLTAAHCVIAKDKTFKVRAGEWDTQTKDELYPHQDRALQAVVVHKDYRAGSLHNDIALLFLASPLEIIDNVDTVCLPSQGTVVEHTRCFASGWGKDTFGKKGKYQVILKKIELPIVASSTCQNQLRTTRLGAYFNLHSSFICAGGEEGKDTCKGDGGSPLVCPIPGHPGRYYQAGIVAWGIGCGENQIPGVYANVAAFTSWIDDQLSLHGYDRSFYSY